MSGQRDWGRFQLLLSEVKSQYTVVLPSREKPPTIGTDVHTLYQYQFFSRLAQQYRRRLARTGFLLNRPNTDQAVVTGRREPIAARTHSDDSHHFRVLLQLERRRRFQCGIGSDRFFVKVDSGSTVAGGNSFNSLFGVPLSIRFQL